MVKLEKIVMRGFKSFRKKTVIPLFDGFNAVIGPNGSGKSNLLDAIVFVLGSSSRSIRAGRMDHIIYNGGHGKKPAEFALVELHLDNSDKTLPEEDQLIIISRRVNRRGTSTYRMNGKVMNKRKLTGLFSKARIHADGHSVIQQGDITNLIKMKPKQRREVIDEIAGIREYNEKKTSAENELEKAETKLKESQIILQQKEEFMNKLKKERDAALQVEALEKERTMVKAQLAFTRVKAVEGELENVDRNLRIKETEQQVIEKKIGGSDENLDDAEKRLKEIDKEILKKSVNIDLRKEIEKLNAEIMQKYNQISTNKREIERLNEMVYRLSKIKERRGEDTRNRAVNSIISLNIDGVEGTLGSLYRVDPKYDVALDVALGGHVNDVIVDSERTAITGVNYLKRNDLGRVRFLPLDRLSHHTPSAKAEIASKMPGISGFAVDLVKYNNEYEIAFKHVLRDTLIAEDVDSAKKIRGLRVITLEGDLFEAGGAIVGGVYRKRKIRKVNVDDITDVQGYETEIKKLENENEELKKEIGELNVLLDEKRKSEKSESKDVEKLEKEKENLESKLDNTKGQRKKVYENKLSLEEEINKLKIRKARLDAEHENVMLDYEPYKNRKDLEKGDPEKLAKRLREIERSLKNLGYTNMKSIDEYDLYRKDYETYKDRVNKLIEERDSVIGMIERIEEKRKIIFSETLEIISAEFSIVFKDLMEGNADLTLEDSDDIDSGLLIQAQPSGKQLLSIDSLSGGEKTMTALAFLFAVQRHKPSPFYIMDEVDAALDKINAEKVGELIKKYAQKSQFIVISHNDSTVTRAERIYGVSMQKGVSKIFGVEMNKKDVYNKKSIIL